MKENADLREKYFRPGHDPASAGEKFADNLKSAA